MLRNRGSKKKILKKSLFPSLKIPFNPKGYASSLIFLIFLTRPNNQRKPINHHHHHLTLSAMKNFFFVFAISWPYFSADCCLHFEKKKQGKGKMFFLFLFSIIVGNKICITNHKYWLNCLSICWILFAFLANICFVMFCNNTSNRP